MMEFLEILSSPWAIRALVTSSFVGITCGLIGSFIVLKNMSLIGDALSHSILPGVYVAFITVGYSTLGFFVGSVVAGLLTAVAITLIQTKVKTKNDAAIGIVFTAMFAIGVIGISSLNNKQGNHLDLKDFLFGNVLGISNQDIVLSFVVLLFTIGSLIVLFRHFFITTFQPIIAETMGISTTAIHYFLMLMLSFAVVAALQSVGVILVVAMLITPASTALLLSHRLQRVIVISGCIGLLSAVIGIITAIYHDLPPGPAIVLIATLFFLLAALFSPQKGALQKYISKRNQRLKILREDIIKLLSKRGTNQLTLDQISDKLDISKSKLTSELKGLNERGVTTGTDYRTLSMKGQQLAENLVRAHRLWESYQVDKLGLLQDQIHVDAERLEHQLTQAQIDSIEAKLGFPANDPHGSPIPQRKVQPPKPLLSLRPKSKGKISAVQITDKIESELWELGLLPNTTFSVKKILEEKVIIEVKGKLINIDASLARKINIM